MKTTVPWTKMKIKKEHRPYFEQAAKILRRARTREIELPNGKCHFLDMCYFSTRVPREAPHCGTAGCIGGLIDVLMRIDGKFFNGIVSNSNGDYFKLFFPSDDRYFKAGPRRSAAAITAALAGEHDPWEASKRKS